MGGKIFKNLVISHTNDFPSKDNDKIRGWIEKNGGKYSREIADDVTHLLTSKQSWKRLSDMVRKARRTRRIRIVRLDWLKDSLMTSKPRRRSETEYSYEQTNLKIIKRRKTESLKMLENLEENSQQNPENKLVLAAATPINKAHSALVKDLSKDGFHPYTDAHGTVYAFNLVRKDVLDSYSERHNLQVSFQTPYTPNTIIPGCKVMSWEVCWLSGFAYQPTMISHVSARLARAAPIKINEPWAQCLQLFESDATPRTYACYTQYTNTRVNKPTTMVIAPPGSTWEFTWTIFKKIFKKKMDDHWETESHNAAEIVNSDGNTANAEVEVNCTRQPSSGLVVHTNEGSPPHVEQRVTTVTKSEEIFSNEHENQPCGEGTECCG